MSERQSYPGAIETKREFGPLHEVVAILSADSGAGYNGTTHYDGQTVTVGFGAVFGSAQEARRCASDIQALGFDCRTAGDFVNGQGDFSLAEVRHLAEIYGGDFAKIAKDAEVAMQKYLDEGGRVVSFGDAPFQEGVPIETEGSLHDLFEVFRRGELSVNGRFDVEKGMERAFLTLSSGFRTDELARNVANRLRGLGYDAEQHGETVRVRGSFSIAELRDLASQDEDMYRLGEAVQQRIEDLRGIATEETLAPLTERVVQPASPERAAQSKLHELFRLLNQGMFMVHGMARGVGPRDIAYLDFTATFSTSYEADRVKEALTRLALKPSLSSNARTVNVSGAFAVTEIRELAARNTKFSGLLRELEEDVRRDQSMDGGRETMDTEEWLSI